MQRCWLVPVLACVARHARLTCLLLLLTTAMSWGMRPASIKLAAPRKVAVLEQAPDASMLPPAVPMFPVLPHTSPCPALQAFSSLNKPQVAMIAGEACRLYQKMHELLQTGPHPPRACHQSAASQRQGMAL